MKGRTWGFVCPEDGGICYDHPDWGDKVWCPSNQHGGNGKFFPVAQVQEGWAMPDKNTGSGLTEAQIKALRDQQTEAAATAGVPNVPIDITEKQAAKAAAKAEKAAAKEASKTAPKEREPKDCECGCGEKTKGGRFIPGHDARLHSRWNAQAKASGFANWKEAQEARFPFDSPEVIAKLEAAAKEAAEAKTKKEVAAE